ncbi:MAG TPA: hypothetical protein VK008_02590 [Sphingobacteriaceae bacterium]|nr:hypothetical protein [Sphingobacteriaceae bacterium]
MSEMRFDRQIQTMRPATAGKRLENEINQWLSRRRFTALRWSWETGPGTPLGGPETVTAITFAYAETGDPEAGHRYQVKAFLPPPAGPGASPSVQPLDDQVARWEQSAGVEVTDRIEVRLGSTLLEAWLLFRRPQDG